MVKRTIQTSKPGYTVGIEYDHISIRAARLASDGRGTFTVERLEDARGDFSDDANLLDGFRQVKSRLGIGMKDAIVTCLAGKQVFASQMPFRRLGTEEMEQALRLELRKTVHFEVATSTLDYQVLSADSDSAAGMTQVLVALASNNLLNRQLALFNKAGLSPSSVDVLPVAVANALWTWKDDGESGHPVVALHVGPQISTIVIDGHHSPFFNRNIYFAAEDVLKESALPAEKHKRIRDLTDEVARSLAFYEKNAEATGFQELLLLGDFLDDAALMEDLQRYSGMPVQRMDLPSKLGSIREPQPGRFDLAIALAFRGEL